MIEIEQEIINSFSNGDWENCAILIANAKKLEIPLLESNLDLLGSYVTLENEESLTKESLTTILTQLDLNFDKSKIDLDYCFYKLFTYQQLVSKSSSSKKLYLEQVNFLEWTLSNWFKLKDGIVFIKEDFLKIGEEDDEDSYLTFFESLKDIDILSEETLELLQNKIRLLEDSEERFSYILTLFILSGNSEYLNSLNEYNTFGYNKFIKLNFYYISTLYKFKFKVDSFKLFTEDCIKDIEFLEDFKEKFSYIIEQNIISELNPEFNKLLCLSYLKESITIVSSFESSLSYLQIEDVIRTTFSKYFNNPFSDFLYKNPVKSPLYLDKVPFIQQEEVEIKNILNLITETEPLNYIENANETNLSCIDLTTQQFLNKFKEDCQEINRIVKNKENDIEEDKEDSVVKINEIIQKWISSIRNYVFYKIYLKEISQIKIAILGSHNNKNVHDELIKRQKYQDYEYYFGCNKLSHKVDFYDAWKENNKIDIKNIVEKYDLIFLGENDHTWKGIEEKFSVGKLSYYLNKLCYEKNKVFIKLDGASKSSFVKSFELALQKIDNNIKKEEIVLFGESLLENIPTYYLEN